VPRRQNGHASRIRTCSLRGIEQASFTDGGAARDESDVLPHEDYGLIGTGTEYVASEKGETWALPSMPFTHCS